MGAMEWRTIYERHIKSAQWRNMRRDIGRLRGNRCERCGSSHRLELHHLTYERLGRELLSDLELLCIDCHRRADDERGAQGRARSSDARMAARYDAALETWATKKYGEDWRERVDEEFIAEEFDGWLERRECD
jgi:hypothetical protein